MCIKRHVLMENQTRGPVSITEHQLQLVKEIEEQTGNLTGLQRTEVDGGSAA